MLSVLATFPLPHAKKQAAQDSHRHVPCAPEEALREGRRTTYVDVDALHEGSSFCKKNRHKFANLKFLCFWRRCIHRARQRGREEDKQGEWLDERWICFKFSWNYTNRKGMEFLNLLTEVTTYFRSSSRPSGTRCSSRRPPRSTVPTAYRREQGRCVERCRFDSLLRQQHSSAPSHELLIPPPTRIIYCTSLSISLGRQLKSFINASSIFGIDEKIASTLPISRLSAGVQR